MEKQDEEIIYQQGDLMIVVKHVADLTAVALLKSTVYGTKGVRYQQTGQEEKIGQLLKPLFFQLYQKEKLIGMYCLDERPISVTHGSIRGFYGRYLAVDELHKGLGYGHLLKQEAIQYVESHKDGAILFYSYIEEKNTRSLAISRKQGFHSAAVLKTFIFRCHSPQTDPRFTRLEPSQLNDMLQLLNDTYQGYSLKTLTHIGYQSNYFVLKEGDEIVAGIQANPVCWRFLHMPGLSGWLMMNLLPIVSVTRRYFNPTNYRFIVPEGLYLKKGRESLLHVLLESVLAHFGLHSALFQIDEKDPLLSLLTQPESGLLSGFQPVKTHVMIKLRELPDEPLQIGSPVYVSSFDFA